MVYKWLLNLLYCFAATPTGRASFLMVCSNASKAALSSLAIPGFSLTTFLLSEISFSRLYSASSCLLDSVFPFFPSLPGFATTV